ncbi:MAG: hypothetical protein HYZ29_14965 [Myxococcales bacterium]|nr:hypothetical protein [Myxococcales bacterium]
MTTRAALGFVVVLGACHGRESPPAPAPGSAPPSSATTTAVAEGPSAPATAPPASPPEGSKLWTFDSDTTGSPPAGFSFGRTGDGREGKWTVRAEPGAPSGANVLAQLDQDSEDYRFPVAFANDPVLRDLDLSVRCKPVSGSVDQACGLVFRLADANNYYVTRANPLESNVRLYFVKASKRQQLASWSGKVTSGVWHTYRVVARGDRLEVHWDGAKVIEQTDQTFGNAGRVGVWTKADSLTYFDDLAVKALE